MNTNTCISCRYVYRVNKDDRWFSWLCKKAPVPQEYNPVIGEVIADPPWLKCINVRRRQGTENDCLMHEPGPNVFSPREMENVA